MNTLEKSIEFIGEDRPCLIFWSWAEDQVVIRRVEIALIYPHTWTSSGEFKPWDEFRSLNIITILSDDQISDLAQQVREEQARLAADDYDDGRMQDWEEKNRRP